MGMQKLYNNKRTFIQLQLVYVALPGIEGSGYSVLIMRLVFCSAPYKGCIGRAFRNYSWFKMKKLTYRLTSVTLIKLHLFCGPVMVIRFLGAV